MTDTKKDCTITGSHLYNIFHTLKRWDLDTNTSLTSFTFGCCRAFSNQPNVYQSLNFNYYMSLLLKGRLYVVYFNLSIT